MNDLQKEDVLKDEFLKNLFENPPSEKISVQKMQPITPPAKRKPDLSEKESWKKLTCLLIPGFLILLLLINIVVPSSDVSENENRALAKFPKLGIEEIRSGAFSEGFENYITDQFVFRNAFISLKRNVEELLGKKDNHNIIMCDDGYLIENTASLTWDNVDSNLQAVNDLSIASRYNITFTVVPTAYEIMQKSLPKNAYSDQYGKLMGRIKKEINEQISVADVSGHLKENSSDYLYYRTDHHQTALGSYFTYVALGEALGYDPYSRDSFSEEKVASDFYGTMWSNSGFADTTPDEMYKFTLNMPYSYSVEFPSENESMDSLYSEEYLNVKDKYSYYLDGNHGVAVVKSSCPERRRLAVIKDSYAHSLVPFLANHFSEIYIVDLRYYNGDIFEYLYRSNVKDVLVLYNQNTFMTDSNLSKISGFASVTPYNVVPDVSYGIVPELEEVPDSYFDDAVFIGDSLTIGLQNHSGFNSEFLCLPGLSIRNIKDERFGDGSTVYDRLENLEHIGKLYIMLGTNDALFGETEEFTAGYEELVDYVRELFPNVIVYCQSIMPISREFEETHDLKNSMIDPYNDIILGMTDKKQCYYMDVHSFYENEDGYLPHEAGGDGVHLSPENYRVFAAYLKKHAVPAAGVVKIDTDEHNIFAGSGEYDCHRIGTSVLESVSFNDTLSRVNDTLIVSNYNVDPEKVCSATLYIGGGATAEEVAVFELADEDYAKDTVKLAKERVENKKNDFRDYMPAEMTKLESPVIIRRGKLVIVCIADSVTEEQLEDCIY